ncbi:MAG TPA: discoidin domain-containing protein, partial [Polyangiaceae bacterium]|nr:discoidin domain-containing protein [Polyangiaceae bacterium]
MRSFEMVALALGFSLVVGCGSEGTSADDVGRLSAALCVEPRLTPLRVTASSSESASYSPERAADGNASTRWSSVFADSAWIQLDFGVARQLERVVLKWETAASKSYTLGISDSESGPFTTIYTQTNGKGGTETASGLHGSGRYLRLTSTARTTGFGISLFELEAYAPVDGACGSPSPKCGSAPLRAVAASASSIESSDYPPSEAIDGIVGTSCGAGNRWSSAYADQQWLMLDLGQPRHLDRVVLRWECAASASYDIQVGLSPTGPWATVYSDPAGNGGVDDARGLNATARYVRVYSRKRTKPFGVSLYEVEIYGDADPMCGVGACTNPALENRTSLSIKSSSIGARVSADTVRSAMRIAQDPSTKKVYLWADSGLRELDLETLSSAPVVSRSAIASALPAG